jgi:hypothetical protein
MFGVSGVSGMKNSTLLIASIAGALTIGASASAPADPRAVIELFTSQGCSSCPPADELLSELRNDSSLITLSLPISYWDYLGWKDTLALPGHTARQKGYSQARGDREVYTPQVVVNGVAQALGSDRDEIEKAVEQSRKKVASPPSLPVVSVSVQVTVNDSRIDVTLPKGSGATAPKDVWLCPLSRSVAVGISRGENRGRTLTYTNVVRGWVKLGTWSGQGETLSVPIDAVKSAGVDAIAVIVQGGSAQKPGAILGASVASL